jgi:hypothetical protein
MKTLSKLIALSLSVMTSTAAFSQAPVVGSSTTTSPSVVKFNAVRAPVSSNISSLPSKGLTPVTSLAQQGDPFSKFDQNHPVFDQFAMNHPGFADRVFKSREQMRDKGISVKQAKDKFQRRADRNQEHAAKIQQLKDQRQQELINHPRFTHFVRNHPRVATEHRMHMMRSHK